MTRWSCQCGRHTRSCQLAVALGCLTFARRCKSLRGAMTDRTSAASLNLESRGVGCKVVLYTSAFYVVRFTMKVKGHPLERSMKFGSGVTFDMFLRYCILKMVQDSYS